MNRKVIWAIANKDIRAITSNNQVWLGLVLLPVLFSVLLPGGLILFVKFANVTSGDTLDMVQKFIQQFPEGEAKQNIVQLPSLNHQIIYVFTNYMLGSFFLLIPVLNALMISLNSLVGEKERRTLESLLFAPIDMKSLFLGKVLATFLPAYAITVISFLLCGLVVDGLTYTMFDRFIFPNWNWIIILLWVTPLFTILTILISTFISARKKSFQEAQQIGGLIVLPVIAIAVSQISGLLFISPQMLLFVGIILFAIDVILLNQIAKMNQRHILFERQVH